jgi:selenium-dependent xanthine dehydrogenase
MRTITFRVNDAEVQVEIPAQSADGSPGSGWTLLEMLRDKLGLVSPKDGCQPQAQCGCCTVLVDGKPTLSCAFSADKAEGRSITTLEGIDELRRGLLAEAFVREGGVQCGFCIPGIALRAVALCARNPEPSRDEILRSLKPHLCRCTGYRQIVDSIERYGRLCRDAIGPDAIGSGLPAESAGGRGDTGRVGTNLARVAGAGRVLGTWPFVDDLTAPEMMFGALRLADHPRATLLALDASKVLTLPGVHRVLTAADVPGDRWVGLIEQDWPVLVALGETTRATGDIVACVVADSQRLAREAAARIEVEYEVLEPVTDPHAALLEGAPLVHPERGTNLLGHSKLKRGDVEKALAESAHLLEDTYRTQRIEHLFLEPESCLAVPGVTEGKNGLHVYSQGQGVFDDQRQIASVLGIAAERVQVELVANGGAFGGKEDLSIQAQTALMAWVTGRPVKMTLTRLESFRIHPKRHPIEMHYKIGCDHEGRLTAVWARMIGDTGAYASVGAKVLERAGGHATGPYRVPHLDIEARAVYTNNPPAGAMRGFGANQAAFALEGMLDRLAEKVGIDGYDIRDRNILELGDRFATGQILSKPFGLRKTLEAVKERYKEANFAGIACGIKNVGLGNGMADIGRAALTVEKDGTIHIRTGFTEMGQGLFTLCVQFAVEATGLQPDRFRVSTDTTHALNCGQTTASRATVLAGHAIAAAGQALKTRLDQVARRGELAGNDAERLVLLQGETFYGEWIYDKTSKLGTDLDQPGGPKTHLTYGFATQVAILDDHGRLQKMIAVHDVGQVLNPVQLAGQIYGSLHMGIGYALTERFELERGVVQASKINDCGVLRAHQMPEMEIEFVQVADPDCPFGARGVGEIGLVPTAPAIAGALYQYDHVVRTRLPMRDSPAAEAILRPQRRGRGAATDQ